MSKTIEKLLDAAFHRLQHDSGPQDPEYVFLRHTLKQDFSLILSGMDKPATPPESKP